MLRCHVQRRVPLSVGGRCKRQHLLVRAAAVQQQRGQGATAPARCKVQQRHVLLVDVSLDQRPPLLRRPAAVLQQRGDGIAIALEDRDAQRRVPVAVQRREQRCPLLVRTGAMLHQRCDEGAATPPAHREVQHRVPVVRTRCQQQRVPALWPDPLQQRGHSLCAGAIAHTAQERPSQLRMRTVVAHRPA
jgi:hypothetical protein